jgi:hypothetical protein
METKKRRLTVSVAIAFALAASALSGCAPYYHSHIDSRGYPTSSATYGYGYYGYGYRYPYYGYGYGYAGCGAYRGYYGSCGPRPSPYYY